ncbi:putative P-type H+-ATPase [Leishmania mexicana MHOM/GT/2001/U1103]|uniref:P-type H(+)-exporting transporter n=1 Tax=Leishmania mexicana (strain MHOM/GT/2001/U1103) TaxID=929439 RepID=E9ART5_LEIMU|nr:putative P-type H+-ATPase [Leishmania mexicana MHOM/GT/2001/U1103]CBZ25656.1 putative P-type H+-ATPase [Leishmania mexicana MHOM/GT/2001/U1103]
MGPEHMPKMGSNVVRGEVEGTVQYTGSLTFFGKTAALLQSVESELGNIQLILRRVMFSLCAISFMLCMCCFIYLLARFYESFRHALQFAVVVLVVSIPIALEIVVTTTLAVGSKHLSKHKIIVTKLSAIEMMSGVNMLCSDKTGTLTLNKMEIQEQCFTFEEGNDLKSTLVLAALAAKWREPPRDALDTMVLGAADLDECDNYQQLNFVPFDPTTKRTAATLVNRRTGEKFDVTKGAPHVILQMVHNQDEINDEVVDIIDRLAARGIRCLSVAKTDEKGRWHMAGILTFLDPPRPDTKETIRRSKEYGVDVKMITGDHLLIAKEMCRMLNLDPNNHLGLAQLPQGKLVTMLYLKISISDFLTLFSSRTGGHFFFHMAPSPILFCGAIISLLVSTMAASFWHKSRPDNVLTEGLAWGQTNAERLLPLWVWIYCIVWWLVQDVVKVLAHICMDAVDLFGCVSEASGSGPIKPYSDGMEGNGFEPVKKPAEKSTEKSLNMSVSSASHKALEGVREDTHSPIEEASPVNVYVSHDKK